MFFSKFLLAVAFCFGLTLQAVQAHAIINNALGVKGKPVRNNVQRPSTAKPCGNVNIQTTLGSTTPLVMNASGAFSTTVTNFNAGVDGSRQVTAKVDAAGTGKNFVAATVTKNGVRAPTSTGTDTISVQLPSGTRCTGGPNRNLCLVSFKTAGNFGNCVAVQQGAGQKRDEEGDEEVEELDVRAVGTRAARAVRQFFENLA